MIEAQQHVGSLQVLQHRHHQLQSQTGDNGMRKVAELWNSNGYGLFQNRILRGCVKGIAFINKRMRCVQKDLDKI